MKQLGLFGEVYPPGFSYVPEFISAEEEARLLAEIQKLAFKPYVYGAYTANRLIAAFGMEDKVKQGHEQSTISEFALPLRARIAEKFAVDEAALTALLFTHYPAGAAIGWHSDAPFYDKVFGISLVSDCIMDFRLNQRADSAEQIHVSLEARGAYSMQGPSRAPWQHRISAAKTERFSVTFRSRR